MVGLGGVRPHRPDAPSSQRLSDEATGLRACAGDASFMVRRWIRDAAGRRQEDPSALPFGPTSRTRREVRVLFAVLLLASCKDEGERAYQHAKAAHLALVEQGARPSAAAFDEVIAELDSVPTGSKRYADAQRLKGAIENARHHVRRPLATVHSNESDLPEGVRAQTRACAALAELLGRDGGATPAVVKALDDCRRRIDRVDRAYHEAHEPPVDDLTQRLEAVLDAGVR